MPKRTDIESILIIGSGPIVVGQACEFDYSGTQACVSLREEGYRIILVNSNPATRMTDTEMAYATYIEPITVEFLTRIIEKERPSALLPTMGGQTALNCAMLLEKRGILKHFGVELIGAKLDVIEKAESRDLFRKSMQKIGLMCPKSVIVNNLDQVGNALKQVGLPAIVRASFTMGGIGSGIATTEEQLYSMVSSGLSASPIKEVQIDKSVLGWKEFELEVVRDAKDNCIVVCVIENLDPAGIHTGDSVTIAPALTLRDSEYQKMRDASIKILREIGVDTGGSNVQFVLNPENQEELLVIEMNPRVSRSSALASKATGFPIAKVAAKLAVGYTLDEIANDCSSCIPASFEPSIDYVIVKFPRFDFKKFPKASPELTTSMKSVGEVMSFGRNFLEAFQKGLYSLEIGLSGCDELFFNEDEVLAGLKFAGQYRLLAVVDALRLGFSFDKIASITKYDEFFILQLSKIVEAERFLKTHGLPKEPNVMLNLKKMGFSDSRIAKLCGCTRIEVQELRFAMNVRPIYKRVDTCAGEFESSTSYMYETYEGDVFYKNECEARVSERKKVIIIGSGPNRIGQGIEFDYACIHAVCAVKEAGYEAIMVNCNPETVSTDYNISDRLYFVPLVWEHIYEIILKEQERGELLGVILQFGGQTPLKLASDINKYGIKILGTSFDSINLAEDRQSFNKLMSSLGILQPKGAICFSKDDVLDSIKNVKFPIIVRPSYVLGGQSMCVIKDIDKLNEYLNNNSQIFDYGSLLVDEFLSSAVEVDVDALSDGYEVKVVGLMEHIEEAGIHSGDSACFLPSRNLSKGVIKTIHLCSEKIAKALNIYGLMNVQYAVKNEDVFVLEVNPRSSRSVPFIAKATGIPIVKIATDIMLGRKLSEFKIDTNIDYKVVKESVFSFSRFIGADLLLGPEMKSTGEVMGIDIDFDLAFAKAQIAAGYKMSLTGNAFISVKDCEKTPELVQLVKNLLDIGFSILGTKGTASYLSSNGLDISLINKVKEGGKHIVDELYAGNVSLLINISSGEKSISDSISIRRAAILLGIPYSTTIRGAKCMISALKAIKENNFDLKSLQEYYKSNSNKGIEE